MAAGSRRAGLAAALLLAGCATASPPAGWVRSDLEVGGRVLASAVPTAQPRGPVLTVVIEGDGRAHDTAGRPTDDPTPADAVGWRIAEAWPDAPKAWLARPCQYVRRRDRACRVEDWTTARFAEPAMAALDAAVSELKRRAGAERVILAGWSGGGVLAAALAHRRSDVAGLATFAAPLDVARWTAAMDLSPLALAPDVAALAAALPPLPQVHFAGSRDRVVPPHLAAPSARAAPEGHVCCWPVHALTAAETLRGARR